VEYVKNMLAAKQKISGFGHRVYKTEDPRATHLRKMSEQLGKDAGVPKWYEMSRAIELYINADKKLNANVDFYSASTYATLGIDIDLYTPIFAISRIAGWAAHVIEQLDDNRLIRPRAEYIGPVYPSPTFPWKSAGIICSNSSIGTERTTRSCSSASGFFRVGERPVARNTCCFCRVKP
jgi:citrate synthase